MTLLCASAVLAGWAAPECPFRKTVEVAYDVPNASSYPKEHLPRGAPEPPGAVRAVVSLEGREPGGVKVFCRGMALPRSVAAVEGTDLHEVVFPHSGRTCDLYFGGGEPLDDGYFPESSGLFLETFRHPTGTHPRALDQMLEIVRKAKKSWGRGPRACIDDNDNPFGYDDYYVSVYQGYILCPVDGTYAFAANADDCAFLLVDGKPVVSQSGKGPRMAALEWRSSRAGGTKLKRGLHLLTYYHSELRGSQRAQAGWRLPGSKETRLIPPSAFADALPAALTAFEEKKGGGVVQRLCMTERTVGRRLVNGRVHARLVELRAVFPGRGDVTFRWTSLGRTELGLSARFWVDSRSPRRVDVFALKGGETVASYARNLAAPRVDRAEEDALQFALDVRMAPSLAYGDERAQAVLAVRGHEGKADLLFEARDASGKLLASGKVRSRPHSWDAFDVPLKQSAERVECTAGLDGAAEERVRFRMLSSRGEWPRLREEGGAFFDEGGARAVVFIPREDEAQYRRWAPVKWLKSAGLRPSGALFAGDPCGGRLSSFLISRGAKVASAETSLALLLAVENSVSNETGEVVIFPGSADLRAGTSVEAFTRALDASIDRVRRASPHARLTLATPLPDPARPRIGARFAEVVRTMAEKHHAGLLDAHAFVASRKNWKGAFRKGDVYRPYPADLMDDIMDRVSEDLF